ncbi:MAG: sulfotransferase [Sneathiellaceae bacterium]
MLTAFVVTTGRTGTRSMTGFLRNLLSAVGRDADARDHSDIAELLDAGLQRLTRANYDPGPVVRMLRGWTHDVEVNPGPCFVLPEILQAFGPDLPILHLVRDRPGYIGSVVARMTAFPHRWGNFIASAEPAAMARVTAVHFGEMSEEAWNGLSLEDKAGWLYDAHKRETERMLPYFRHTLKIHTSELNEPGLSGRIARFLGLPASPDIAMSWYGRARDMSLDKAAVPTADVIDRSFVYLDWNRVSQDPSYPFQHFLQVELARALRGDAAARQRLAQAGALIEKALAGGGSDMAAATRRRPAAADPPMHRPPRAARR